jgi:hypothetical protein
VTRVSVVIPTHDHASTLRLAVESVLRQTMADLEVLIVGDGVTEAVRDVATGLEREDDRVRFLDFEKGPHHGEIHRDAAIRQSTGEIIAYLCDDDLFMPRHLADMVDLLADHDLTQSLNGYVNPDGTVGLFSGSLDDEQYVARLCDPSKEFNFIGITGTAHTREIYDRTGTPWETTPAGVYPDQHQWRRMLLSGVPIRGTTSPRMTVIGLPTSMGGRDAWTPEERQAELERWAELARSPEGQDELDRRVADGAVNQLRFWTLHAFYTTDLQAAAERNLVDAVRNLAAAEERVAAAEHRVETITASRWWRLGKRLRPGLSGREA